MTLPPLLLLDLSLHPISSNAYRVRWDKTRINKRSLDLRGCQLSFSDACLFTSSLFFNSGGWPSKIYLELRHMRNQWELYELKHWDWRSNDNWSVIYELLHRHYFGLQQSCCSVKHSLQMTIHKSIIYVTIYYYRIGNIKEISYPTQYVK